ncbi:hypothetical protein [Bradyrhizobium sp. Tv2a-2]|uniref:hypothetical protein n=1 Tax=Bradyrhizobium sp. Tv2a-2 TaxID=113395 RepID=UPI0003F66FE2|nr:hypothetical protein [Bradyrhizobium sp. Tv2a-2]
MPKGIEAREARRSFVRVPVASRVSEDLRAEAKRRGVEYDDLAAEIIDTVVNHGLYAAVLDH